MNILIYEPHKDARKAFSEVAAHLCADVTISCTGQLTTAKTMVEQMRPDIIITDAIPELDIMHPDELPEHDSGTALITYIRQHEDPKVNTAWIIVAASRLMECVPMSFCQLLGEHAFLCKKPEVIFDLKDLLPSMVDVLSRKAP